MIKASRRLSTPARQESASPLAAAWQNPVVAIMLAMVVLIPLITGTPLLNSAGKLAAFEVLGALLLAAILPRIRLGGAAARCRDTVLAGPNLPIVLLVAFAAVSAVVSPYRLFSLTEFLRIGLCALLYFASAYHLRRRDCLQALADGLLLVTALVSLFGLAEMGVEGSGDGMTGSFGSHELLGSFLMLLLPVALALGLTERGDSKRQMAAQVVALLAAACLLMARTRSAWLGAVVSLIALSLLAVRFSPACGPLRRRKHRIVGPLLILAGAVALFVLLSQAGPTLGRRAGTLAHVGTDDSFQARLAMWRGTLRMIAARPLLGWGVGTYPVREAQFTGHGREAAWVLARGADHNNLAHNFYLQTAAEMGLLGLGLSLTPVVLFFMAGLRALGWREPGLRRSLLMGCLAAMAGQAIDALGSPAYNFASVGLFPWLLMGLGMSAADLGPRPQSAPETPDQTASAAGMPTPVLRGLRLAAGGLAAIVLLPALLTTLDPALATSQTCGGTTYYISNGGTISNNSSADLCKQSNTSCGAFPSSVLVRASFGSTPGAAPADGLNGHPSVAFRAVNDPNNSIRVQSSGSAACIVTALRGYASAFPSSGLPPGPTTYQPKLQGTFKDGGGNVLAVLTFDINPNHGTANSN